MAPAKKKAKKNGGPTKKNGADNNNGIDMDTQMQQVLQLLSARTKGEVTNDEVEQAVSKILSTAGLAPAKSTIDASSKSKVADGDTGKKKADAKEPEVKSPPKPTETVAESTAPKIQMDTENYDDEDEEEEDDNKLKDETCSKDDAGMAANDSSNAPTAPATTNSTTKIGDEASNDPKPPIKRRRRSKKNPLSPEEIEQQEERKRQYELIPLGKQGASMMTSFGDGPNPLPETVSAALLGARRLLQVTIQDARALRRKAKQQFKKAQMDVNKDYKNKKERLHDRLKREKEEKKGSSPDGSNIKSHQQPTEFADPHMLYRALTGHDKLAYEPKCGFDYDQLKSLFPEEMQAYARWDQLRAEYASKDDKPSKEGDNGNTNTKETGNAAENEDMEEENPAIDPEGGGHLVERAVQFDIRTDKMNQGWYMQFSEHRKGSFLPRRLKHEGDGEWEEQRKKAKKKGPAENGVWAHMQANSARFLHWVGFDPNRGLPPCNEETTHALGFLGYDFMGRIVEKAIFLKNLAKAKDEDEEIDERTIILELSPGEQLSEDDILEAMNDPDIKPAALYSSVDGSASHPKPAAQLYFGPGFEARLEMELDELVCGSQKRTDLTEEEAKIRQAEDKLFAEIAAPPTTNNAVMELLGKDDNDNQEIAEIATTPPKTNDAVVELLGKADKDIQESAEAATK